MASTSFKFYILLVVFGVSVVLFESAEGGPGGPKNAQKVPIVNKSTNLAVIKFVGEKEDLTILNIKYQTSPNYLPKIQKLLDSYSHIRRVVGDGNCFFRSFAFGYFEYLQNHSQEIEQFKILVQSINNELPIWFEKDEVNKFYKKFEKVIKTIESGNSDANTKSLYNIFNDATSSNYVVSYLRLITSREIQTNESKYENYILDQNVQQFCKDEVEIMYKESDHVHLAALGSALNVNIQVVYMDATESTNLNVLTFPFENRRCSVHLLFTPSHYDILYSIRN